MQADRRYRIQTLRIDQLLQDKMAAHQASFSLAALNSIRKMVSEGFISSEQGQKAFKYETRVQLFVSELNITQCVPARIEPPPKVPRYIYGPLSAPHGVSSVPSVSHTKPPPTPSETLTQFAEVLLKDKDTKLAQVFFEKLESQVDQIPTMDVPGLWLPFLCSLSGLLKANEIPLTTPLYRNLYVRLLCSWLTGFVGRQPRPNTSLARPEVPCACRDCYPLNVFLADGSRTCGRFALAKPRRQHLHQNLERARIDASHRTERVGRPQTLVVTKTDTEYQRQTTAWRQRVALAKKEVAQFPQADLREVLGTRLYQVVQEGQPITYEEAQLLLMTPMMMKTASEGGNPAGAGGGGGSGGGLTPEVLQPTAGNHGGSSRLDMPASVALPKIGNHAALGGMAPQSLPSLHSVIGVKRPAPDSENTIDLTGDSD